jgi:hypothetical protein
MNFHICTKCDTEKPEDEFDQRSDGRFYWCQQCQSDYAKSKRRLAPSECGITLEGLQLKIRENSSAEPNSGCWLFDGQIASNGYGHLYWDGKIRLAHRMSYIAFNGPIPEGLFVCHRCDTKCCVRPSHLWVGTRVDNAKDMVQKGRNVTYGGEEHYLSKLTDSDVIDIYAMYFLLGFSCPKIAESFSVKYSNIGVICHGRQWKHLSNVRSEIMSIAGLCDPPSEKMSSDQFFRVMDIWFDEIKSEALSQLLLFR